MKAKVNLDRRNFILKSATITTGLLGQASFQPKEANKIITGDDLYVIGPMKGFTPLIGTLVSMLNYNRQTIIKTVKSLTMEQLDYLPDSYANSIGALIMHLGATDKYYQINTFEGREEFNEEEKKIWGAAMELGEVGRKQIKGRDVKYYLDLINGVRQKTIEELKKKDDKWLLTIDPTSTPERPTNTYWKWFHVCEHESNHRGQMTWQKSRLPGSKFSEK